MVFEVILLMCLSHLNFDCKMRPMNFVESVFFESGAMKFVGELDGFLFLSDS